MYAYTYIHMVYKKITVHLHVYKMKSIEARNTLDQLAAMRLCSVHMLDGIGKKPQGHKQGE